MPKAKQRNATLSALVDSDSDDHFAETGAMPIPDSAAEIPAVAKKGRGRAKTTKVAPTKVVKAKAPSRRSITKPKPLTAAQKKASKRRALADKTNQQVASDTEEVDEFAQDEEPIVARMEIEDTVVAVVEETQPKQKAASKKAAAKRGKAAKEVDHIEAVVVEAQPKAKSRPGRKKAPVKEELGEQASPEKVVLETQVDAMNLDVEADDEVEETVSVTVNNAARSRSDDRARQPPVKRRRAGSSSDTERDNPSLRRKLGDMTKKYDALHIRFQDLKEIASKDADHTFDQYKKLSEEKEKALNNLISSLKADVAAQTAIAKESKTLKKKLDSQSTDMAALHAQITQLNASLSESKKETQELLAEKKTLTAENKTLSTKLAANRNIAASVESATVKVPGSAVKAGGIRMVGTAEAAQAAQAAQLKEDLYGDLTGLIIMSVARKPEEDIFDCIQTGRNGTLHFKLDAANEKASDNYDDAQCNYVPQLDPSRDASLIQLLPDYLVDEISFPRSQAAKFYARVVKALTEQVA
ncbi:hypothetical protein HYFRA_00011310 [Hymenoscyphus fraxineus]|uniref:Monopolin complex subunit Csm1/Pcs1 C-terminal domain-containing protein n=1 Tax=Hymenoscyphus fraxineus TaxID=746836 RepID=A0A9N9PV83_9HELO|nr:hypothetical protein HYFRA_00011310 [Hymenoscyphus fraxineus]